MNNDRHIIVLGAGGHAKVLLDTLLSGSVTILGIIDNDSSLLGTSLLGVPVLGGDQKLNDLPKESVWLVNGVGSVAPINHHRKIYEKFKMRGYLFKSVIHPSSIIAKDIELPEGIQVMAGAILQTGTSVGENTIINTGASADHDCEIGAHVQLGPSVTLSGRVKVGDDTHIGTGANIVQGVRIGRGSFVGAGALVIQNLPDGTYVRAIPAERTLPSAREKGLL